MSLKRSIVRASSLEPTRAYTMPVAHDSSPARTVELVADSAPTYTLEIERLLRSRLRAVAVVIAGATVVLMNLRRVGSNLPILALQIGSILGFGGIAALLSSRIHLSLRQLRWLEVGIFGLAGLCFVVLWWLRLPETAEGAPSEVAASFLIVITLWWGMMNIYLVLIPSSLRRLTAMMLVMGLVPIVQTLAARQEFQTIREFAGPQFIRVIVGLMVIAVAGTIYLGYSVGVLRRQALTKRLFGQYRLKELIGSGGMGEVHLAEHLLLKRPCAIKVIHPSRANDPDALARFEQEVRAAAELTHPNTIAIYDYGRADDGSFYYVMEYLPGLTLAELVEGHGPQPPERVIYLLRQVCGALGEAHSRGLIHRDIKPGNIIVTERGGSADFVKLLDFGLVKAGDGVAATHVTQENVIAGSPLFMSPEQSIAARKLDGRSDLYSLGAVAYFLLTGQPPFSGESTMEIIVAHARDAARPPTQLNSEVPKDLEGIVLRCLAKDREARFHDADALDRALAVCESAGRWNPEAAAKWWSERVGKPRSAESRDSPQGVR